MFSRSRKKEVVSQSSEDKVRQAILYEQLRVIEGELVVYYWVRIVGDLRASILGGGRDLELKTSVRQTAATSRGAAGAAPAAASVDMWFNTRDTVSTPASTSE